MASTQDAPAASTKAATSSSVSGWRSTRQWVGQSRQPLKRKVWPLHVMRRGLGRQPAEDALILHYIEWTWSIVRVALELRLDDGIMTHGHTGM
jgi:hypothetical protein